MAVATSILVGSAIAAGASAGASIYSANKQAGAAKEAAQTQSTAATKTAQIQSDSANRAAEIQAQSGREALDFSRGQSQVSLDQYNQQQQRLQPYRNLGNFALGMGPDAAPAPIQLPPLPGQSGQSHAQTPQPSGGNDPANYTLSLIQGGMSPQEAASKANQQFNLQTGAQAVYYPDTNTIGLPNVYLAGPTGKPDSPAAWSITQRAGGGSAGPTARQPVTLGYQAAATPFATKAPLTSALQAPAIRYRPLGSIGEY